jgi:hypothetical protein
MKKIFFLCVILIAVQRVNAQSSDTSGQERFIIGFKAGLNHSYIIVDPQREYIYEIARKENPFPIGFTAGIYTENEFTQNLSLVAELSFKSVKMEIQGYLNNNGIQINRFSFNYINLSILPKLQLSGRFFPYILAGLDFGYLIKARYTWNDIIYHDNGSRNNKNELPSITTSICMGLGKEFNVSGTNFLIEGRFLTALSKYKTFFFENNWRKNEFQLLIGVPVNI